MGKGIGERYWGKVWGKVWGKGMGKGSIIWIRIYIKIYGTQEIKKAPTGICKGILSGADEGRTRDLRRDRPAF